MKLNKIINRLNDILDDERREQLKEIDSLKVSIKRLKKKQHEYAELCEKELDEKQKEKILGKIETVRAQRKKGIKLLKSLKKELKERKK